MPDAAQVWIIFLHLGFQINCQFFSQYIHYQDNVNRLQFFPQGRCSQSIKSYYSHHLPLHIMVDLLKFSLIKLFSFLKVFNFRKSHKAFDFFFSFSHLILLLNECYPSHKCIKHVFLCGNNWREANSFSSMSLIHVSKSITRKVKSRSNSSL